MNRLADTPNLSPLAHRLAIHYDQINDYLISHQLLVAGVLLLATFIFITFIDVQPTRKPKPKSTPQLLDLKEKKEIKEGKMQAPDVKLDEPKDTPFTTEQLKEFDGTNPSKPIYVAIKGKIFDVSAKKEMYGEGGGYAVFAGKDGSAGLGKSSLKPEDAIADYSKLDAAELKVLNDWVAYFTKRYNIIGKVVD